MIVVPSRASVFGSSNLDLFGDPKPKCFKPVPPYRADKYAAETFQADADEYISCANKYIENANNDIERIVDEVKALKRDAESPD